MWTTHYLLLGLLGGGGGGGGPAVEEIAIVRLAAQTLAGPANTTQREPRPELNAQADNRPKVTFIR